MQQQYSGVKRTRDDVVTSEGTQQFGVPQSSMTVSTPGHSFRGPIVCYGCGKKGHMKRHCKSQHKPPVQSAPVQDRKSVV